MNPGDKKQKSVSGLILAGICVMVGSVFLFALGIFFGAAAAWILGLLGFPVGLVLTIMGLASGWGEAFGDPSKKPVTRANNAYVIAKVVADKKANPVIDPEFHDPSELRYLVQMEVPARGKIEFETASEVFNLIGEGMSGDIVYQGRWLSQFTFRPKAGDREIGEDPFAARRQP